ncbi:MAG: ribulose-phosphate 3-epimerase [Dehalococcoidia bacterium]|nr:ribulose-phosphate 3-epimerase [Dehalococcoidia bacterium]
MSVQRVVPAILTDDAAAFTAMARSVETFADWVQVDIMDGFFVPSRSISAADVAAAGLKTGWEAHLMVENPVKYLEDFACAGASRIIVHYESAPDSIEESISVITALGVRAGLALNPETDISVLSDNLLSRLQTVLFMAVHPGYYGAQFIPETLEKIAEFRRRFPCMCTAIDGGVKMDNIGRVASTGVNEICVGSAVFAQSDRAAAYRNLSKLLHA